MRVEEVLTRRVEAQWGVPVVIDDALAGQPAEVVERALTRLVALAFATQIVYLEEGAEVAEQATAIARAGVEIIAL